MKFFSLLLSLMPIALAYADFKGEVAVSSSSMEEDETIVHDPDNVSKSRSTDDSYALNLSIFMKPLSHDKEIPNDEILFAERIGVIELFWSKADQDYFRSAPSLVNQYNGTLTDYGISVLHRTGKLRHAIKMSLGREEIAGESTFRFGRDLEARTNRSDLRNNRIGTGYSYYVEDNLTIGINADWREVLGAEIWSFEANARQLIALPNEHWLALEAGIEWAEIEFSESEEYSLKAIYYFSPRTGIFIDGGKLENGERVTVGMSHYFQDNFSMGWSFSNSGPSDTFRDGGRFRF